MELSDKIKYCTICRNSKRDIERGIVCGLTNEKPAFNKHCADLQASAHDIAELEESMIGGSQKSAIKIITALIIVAFGIAMGIMWLIHSYEANKAEQAAQAAKQKIEALDALLKAKMATLPQTIGEGITMDSICLKKKYVNVMLSLSNTYIQDYPDDRLICESKYRHCEMLKHLRSEDPELLKTCLNDSLQIRYAFRESTKFPIYTIVIHPDDIKKALNTTEEFRCPRKDLERALRSETKPLPYDVVDKIQLSAIKPDYATNTLKLNVRMRRKAKPDKAMLTQIVENELWKNVSEFYSVRMMMLNEGIIDFRFIGTDDRLQESITVGPDFYGKKF